MRDRGRKGKFGAWEARVCKCDFFPGRTIALADGMRPAITERTEFPCHYSCLVILHVNGETGILRVKCREGGTVFDRFSDFTVGTVHTPL
jgi:hypothetical protein